MNQSSAAAVSGNIRAADMFLTRALEKILSDKEIKKQASAQLKKYCDSLLGMPRFIYNIHIHFFVTHLKYILSLYLISELK
jgi:hypothetical protein